MWLSMADNAAEDVKVEVSWLRGSSLLLDKFMFTAAECLHRLGFMMIDILLPSSELETNFCEV